MLEDNVYVGPHVIMTNAPNPDPKMSWKKVGVTVKKGARVEAGAILIGPITISENAVIGPGCLITDVPAGVEVSAIGKADKRL